MTEMEEGTKHSDGSYNKRPLWQWIIIYIIIGAIVYAGIYYFFINKKGGLSYSQPAQNQTEQTSNQQVSSQSSQESLVEQTITYTQSGFSPVQITVKSGDRITWVNKSDREVQIGANPHPVHSGNREVSGGEYTLNLGPGEQKSVVLSETGTFGYHNHLNPSEEGTIIVE